MSPKRPNDEEQEKKKMLSDLSFLTAMKKKMRRGLSVISSALIHTTVIPLTNLSLEMIATCLHRGLKTCTVLQNKSYGEKVSLKERHGTSSREMEKINGRLHR